MNDFLVDTETIKKICLQNDVEKIGLFGSVARGEATKESDLDILVKFSKRKSLLEVIKLERELTETLGRKVDLLTEKSISPYIRDNILNDLMIIYEYE